MGRRKSKVLEKHDKLEAGDLIKITSPYNLYYNKKDAINFGFGLHYNIPNRIGSFSSNDENLYFLIKKTEVTNQIGADYFLINVIDSTGEKWMKIYESINFDIILSKDNTSKGKP